MAQILHDDSFDTVEVSGCVHIVRVGGFNIQFVIWTKVLVIFINGYF